MKVKLVDAKAYRFSLHIFSWGLHKTFQGNSLQYNFGRRFLLMRQEKSKSNRKMKYCNRWQNIYHNDCLQNFLLLFMYLLTGPIFKSSHIFPEIYFIVLKERPRHAIPNLHLSESSYQERQVLALLWNLVALILG